MKITWFEYIKNVLTMNRISALTFVSLNLRAIRHLRDRDFNGRS
jgi:hypothetical protein